MGKKLAFLTFLVLGWSQAHAGFEIRAAYSQWNGTASGFNNDFQTATSGFPAAKAPATLGGDVLFVVPVMGLAVGLRHEIFQDVKGSGSVADTKLSGSRTSLLGGYRFIDTVGFLGALAHIGVSQKASYDLTIAGADYPTTGDVGPSYGLGVEGGAKLSGFLVGAELGYTVFKINKFKDNTGGSFTVSGKEASMDLSGTYLRFMLGFAFL